MSPKLFPIDIIKDNKFSYELISKEPRIKLKNKLWNDDKTVNAYIPSKDNIIIAYKIPPIEHEIAHIVEMNDYNRLVITDFDMPFRGPKASLFYNKKSVYITSCARETRVRAIQSIIEGKEDYDSFTAQPLNNAMLKLTSKFFDNTDDTRFKSSADFVDWLQNIRMRTMNLWDKDRVVFEWNKRIEFIQNWMEHV